MVNRVGGGLIPREVRTLGINAIGSNDIFGGDFNFTPLNQGLDPAFLIIQNPEKFPFDDPGPLGFRFSAKCFVEFPPLDHGQALLLQTDLNSISPGRYDMEAVDLSFYRSFGEIKFIKGIEGDSTPARFGIGKISFKKYGIFPIFRQISARGGTGRPAADDQNLGVKSHGLGPTAFLGSSLNP